MIAAQLGARRWARVLRGVYSTQTGKLSSASWLWAAHLYAGEESVICLGSALQAWRLAPFSLPVHVAVPWRQQWASVEDAVVLHRHRRRRPARSPRDLPPALTIEAAIIDTAGVTDRATEVAGLVTAACQRGHTTPARLARAMSSVQRIRHRRFIIDLLGEIQGGATTMLEVPGVRRILRAHGLPEGVGQVRERQGDGIALRDRVIRPYGLVIEFDGRVGHADPEGRLRDHRRDNAVVLSGRPVLRFGWVDVHEEACEAARQVATVLARLGWDGHLTPCGPACRATSPQWVDLDRHGTP